MCLPVVCGRQQEASGGLSQLGQLHVTLTADAVSERASERVSVRLVVFSNTGATPGNPLDQRSEVNAGIPLRMGGPPSLASCGRATRRFQNAQGTEGRTTGGHLRVLPGGPSNEGKTRVARSGASDCRVREDAADSRWHSKCSPAW